MRKEVILVTIIGIVIGLIVAFGAWRTSSVLQVENTKTPPPQSQETTSLPEDELRITLAKPEENSVLAESPTLISGISKANAWLVISGEEEDYILQASASGVFEQNLELIGGVNQLAIYAFNNEKPPTQKNLTVIYSTEFAKEEE
jgi:hypothetical protein